MIEVARFDSTITHWWPGWVHHEDGQVLFRWRHPHIWLTIEELEAEVAKQLAALDGCRIKQGCYGAGVATLNRARDYLAKL
jgi:hypothetical protein